MRSRATATAILVAVLATAIAAPASADPSFETFDDKEGWICGEDEGLVDNHCLNVKAKGNVLNVKVFAPDPRGPQESASFDPRFDDRPCPHDAGSDDGTWWEFSAGLYVCHHSGIQP